MQPIVNMNTKCDKTNKKIDMENTRNSVLPNFHSCLLVCGILCAHVFHNVRDIAMISDGMIEMLVVAVVGSLAAAVAMQFKAQSCSGIDKKDSNSDTGKSSSIGKHNVKSDKSSSIVKKNKISVLPNFHSCLLIGGIICAHVLHNVRESGILGTARVIENGVDASCVSERGSVFPFCLPETNRVNHSDGMINIGMLVVAVVGALAVAVTMQLGRVQSLSSMSRKEKASTADMNSKSDKSNSVEEKKNKTSVLPNFHSLLLVCGIFCAHALHNLRESGILGAASVIENGIDISCVTKHGSVFPFCLPDMDQVDLSGGMIKVLVAMVIGCLALAAVMQSGWVQSCNKDDEKKSNVKGSKTDKKDKISVLPNFHSLMLVCGIFCAHVLYNLRESGILRASVNESAVDASCVSKYGSVFPFCLPDINSVGPSNDLIAMLAVAVVGSLVGAVVMQLCKVHSCTSVDKKQQISVLPNFPSLLLVCGIFSVHAVHNVQGDSSMLTSASVILSAGIVKLLPSIGFLLVSLVVGAFLMQSSSTSKSTKVSVLPNSFSVMLIGCVLCAHVAHNRPELTIMGSPEAGAGTILGEVSAIQSFGEKDNDAEDFSAKVVDSIVGKGSVGTGSTISDTYDTMHSEIISKASPKAIFASVLLAFIAMTLKMGAKNNDKKAKPSVLPNARSILFICCLFFGHIVHNWQSTNSEHNSQVSVYTGVDEVASWDEYGSVLPDTIEDMDNLLEASPDMLTEA